MNRDLRHSLRNNCTTDNTIVHVQIYTWVALEMDSYGGKYKYLEPISALKRSAFYTIPGADVEFFYTHRPMLLQFSDGTNVCER